MPLGTLDREPPPFFRQGPSARTKLAVCAALAVFLMAADTRLDLTQPLRSTLATALLPVQRTLAWPVDLAAAGREYFQGLQSARQAELAARTEQSRLALRASQVERLEAESARLRALLELRPSLAVKSQAAQVMYEAPDPFSRKVFIDRGGTHGVALGAPVINEAGVVGQVTRLYPLSAVVTLLGDRDAAVPVLNSRTQQRSVAVGGIDGGMELRFVAGNADVQVGDLLSTSGLDGVYAPGLAVGRVVQVDRRAESGFARILVAPAAALDGVRFVLVLEPFAAAQLPFRPEPESPPARPGKATRK
jgi:rod shape-determining protein MreC